MTAQIPIVDYLHLGDAPTLSAHECSSCGARYFDRRNACAGCGGISFAPVSLPSDGIVTAFSIVTFAAPGVPVPFVAAVIDCGGTSVRGNVIHCDPSPEAVTLGMRVRLATYSLGPDDNGVEAIGFGYEPAT